MIFESVIDL